MPPLTSLTATPILNSLLRLQLPLHVYIYIYIQETLLQIFFLHSSSTFDHNFPFLLTPLPPFSTKKNTSKNSKLTLTGVPISPWHLPLLDKHNDLSSILFVTTSSTVGMYLDITCVCVCVYHSRGLNEFQGGERFSERKITRRGERNAGKRELTGRLRDERDPRPSLAMETGFGPLNWPLRSAAGPTRPCACANRPPPRVQRRVVGRAVERQPSYLDLLVFTPTRVYTPHLLHLRIFLLRWQHLTLRFAPCFYLTVA